MLHKGFINIQLFGEPAPTLEEQNKQLDESDKDQQISKLTKELADMKKQRDDAMLTNQRLYALYAARNVDDKNDTEGDAPKITKMEAIQEAIRSGKRKTQ